MFDLSSCLEGENIVWEQKFLLIKTKWALNPTQVLFEKGGEGKRL